MIRRILRDFRNYLKLKKFQDLWIKERGNNYTKAGCIFPKEVVEIGDYTYGTLNVHYYKTENEKLIIGKYCSIAEDVHFYTGGGHCMSALSTFPFKNYTTGSMVHESITKGSIILDDDVWIGASCIILSGVHIGKGAVIGAGSIVARNIPPYAVFCGGEIKKYRFDEEVRKKLYEFDLSHIKLEKAESMIDLLYTSITKDNVDEVIKKLEEYC